MSSERYVVIGAGGTASHLIHALVQFANVEDKLIHVWDADTVEERNLERQLFFESEVNKHKAQAFADRWPLTVIPHLKYVGEDNVATVIRNDDVVLICADNMAVRRVINEHAKTLENVQIINGGNEKISGSVQYFERLEGMHVTPPLDFHSPEFDPSNDEVDRSTLSCAQIAELPGGEQTIFANQTTAAIMLAALWRGQNDIYHGTDKNWTKLTFDHDDGLVQTTDLRVLKGALNG